MLDGTYVGKIMKSAWRQKQKAVNIGWNKLQETIIFSA